MNFNKIGVVAVSMAALLFTASCNNTQKLSYEKAYEWVEKHCKSGSSDAKVKRVIDYSKTTGEAARNYVIDSYKNPISEYVDPIELDKNLKYNKTDEVKSAVPHLDVATFEITYGTFAKEISTFTLSNGVFTATITMDLKDSGAGTGKSIMISKWNSKGVMLSTGEKDVKVKYQGLDGTINGSDFWHYSY